MDEFERIHFEHVWVHFEHVWVHFEHDPLFTAVVCSAQALSCQISKAMSSAQIVDQMAAALKEVCDQRIKEIEETYQRRIVDLETHIRHRDRRIEDLQELLTMRDASVKSLLTSLKECHSAMDQLQNDKKLLQKDKKKMQQRIDDLERRPEPMPHGMPELTRAALDQVRRWDSDARVDEQRKTIWYLSRDVKHNDKEIARLEEEVENMRMGHGLQMNDVWMGMFEHFETTPMGYWPWHYSTRSLHDFLWHLGTQFLKKDHEDYEARQEDNDEDE